MPNTTDKSRDGPIAPRPDRGAPEGAFVNPITSPVTFPVTNPLIRPVPVAPRDPDQDDDEEEPYGSDDDAESIMGNPPVPVN